MPTATTPRRPRSTCRRSNLLYAGRVESRTHLHRSQNQCDDSREASSITAPDNKLANKVTRYRHLSSRVAYLVKQKEMRVSWSSTTHVPSLGHFMLRIDNNTWRVRATAASRVRSARDIINTVLASFT